MKGLRGWQLWAVLGIAAACASVPLYVQNDYLLQVLFRIALGGATGHKAFGTSTATFPGWQQQSFSSASPRYVRGR